MSEQSPLIVIGAGGAGLLAAGAAAAAGARVLLLERNRKPGIKLLISGGGKCNITHAGPMEVVRADFPVRQARFLKPSFYRFSNEEMLRRLEHEGVQTYTRENGRVFPKSGRADDVVDTLVRSARRAGAVIRLNARVQELLSDERGVSGVRVDGEQIMSRHVLVVTGGVSYPKTGTTGDGLQWAERLGHTIVPLRPALAPIGVQPALPAAWRGVAVRGGQLAVYVKGRKIREHEGDILFTHEGVSGPAALEVSNAAARAAEEGGGDLLLDFFPGREFQDLDTMLRRRVEEQRGKMLETLLYDLLPNRIVGDLLRSVGVDPEVRGHVLRSDQRHSVVKLLKGWRIGRVGEVKIERGEVTAGGVRLDEVDPQTMRSRVRPGLYLAGEILDIDGPVGGYNLQAAFSTGVAAGEAMARDWHSTQGS